MCQNDSDQNVLGENDGGQNDSGQKLSVPGQNLPTSTESESYSDELSAGIRDQFDCCLERSGSVVRSDQCSGKSKESNLII